VTVREALKVFQEYGIVRYPGPALKANQALRVLRFALTTDEYDNLRSARGCVLDNAGHDPSEFNDACEAVRKRFDREKYL
jgi:hypothetical protein